MQHIILTPPRNVSSGETGSLMITTHFCSAWIPRLQRGLLVLILCGGFMVAQGAYPLSAADNDGRTHVVQAGETLSGIAQRYQVGLQQLARYNGITNINQIRVGQRLRIPPTGTPTLLSTPTRIPEAPNLPAPPRGTPAATPTPRPPMIAPASPARNGEVSYIVYAGDSLTGIGARFGVSVGAIMARNHLPSSTIYVGQRLIIPVNVQPVALSTPAPTIEIQMEPTPTLETPVELPPLLEVQVEPAPTLEFQTTLPAIVKEGASPDEGAPAPAPAEDP